MLLCHKIHYIFIVPIYALFPPILWSWKVVSAFWMYGCRRINGRKARKVWPVLSSASLLIFVLCRREWDLVSGISPSTFLHACLPILHAIAQKAAEKRQSLWNSSVSQEAGEKQWHLGPAFTGEWHKSYFRGWRGLGTKPTIELSRSPSPKLRAGNFSPGKVFLWEILKSTRREKFKSTRREKFKSTHRAAITTSCKVKVACPALPHLKICQSQLKLDEDMYLGGRSTV